MMPYRPYWTLRAQAQLEAAERWWAQERGSDLIERELDRVFDILAMNPSAGHAVPRKQSFIRLRGRPVSHVFTIARVMISIMPPFLMVALLYWLCMYLV